MNKREHAVAAIKHYVAIKAPIQTLYGAITQQKGLSEWWTRDTVAEPCEGTVAEFTFDDKYHNKMHIARLTPYSLVHWECIAGDKEWVGTHITFALEEQDSATILRFAHHEWKAETDFFAGCNYHWGFYMHSLKEYCETGKGIPHQERRY